MESRKRQIPTGMQETLPGECARKRQLEAELRRLFALQGYQEVETPILEYYDALDDRTWGFRPEHVWKTFDSAGRILAIRPDSTIPAARMAALRLTDAPLPIRLCYVQSATKMVSDTSSLLCEETQCGVELMGEPGPAADAEVIALAIGALKQSGLADFQIELGHSQFMAGLLEEAGLTAEQCAGLRALTEQKRLTDMRAFLAGLALPEETQSRLMRLPSLYGDACILEEAARLSTHPKCRAAIDNLKQVLAILQAYGCDEVISIDLGMAHHQNYYSGTIFRGLVAELGQPLLSGGRYDRLMSRFGRDLPATGFALSMKLLLIALERQGADFPAPTVDVAVGFDDASLAQAIAWAQTQRAKGVRVAMAYGASAEALQSRVDAGQAKSAVFFANGTQTGKAVDACSR